MLLTNNEIKIKDIMLDPYNPRLIKQANISQDELLSKILATRDAKEIMTSMQRGIKWVNRIVVQNIEDLPDDHKKYLKNQDQYKHIAVEGNTRLACLKSEKIDGINEDSTIPVLLAQKEKGESENHFQTELRITQGIANVMVVKEWRPLAKARHLYLIFRQREQEIDSNDVKIQDVYKEISSELGVRLSEVRTGVTRYAIFSEIAKESDTLEENNWPYLEAFDQNDQVRSLIGMKKDSISFEWEDEEQNPESIEKHELLNEIPTILDSAAREGIQAKQFRNIFKRFVQDKEIEEIRSTLEKITDKNEDVTWKEIQGEMEEIGEEQKWRDELQAVFNKLDNFPSASDWATKCKDELNKIKDKVKKHLKVIEISNE